jgi:hypothetical protein
MWINKLTKIITFIIFKKRFLRWSESVIEKKKEDGFAVCPFAKRSRIKDKIQFIDARHNTFTKLNTFNKEDYDIGIVWLGDDYDMSIASSISATIQEEHTDLLYFTSTPTSGYFAKNFTNCIFIQLADDIEEKRKQLHTTSYYDSWSEDYYKIIIGKL